MGSFSPQGISMSQIITQIRSLRRDPFFSYPLSCQIWRKKIHHSLGADRQIWISKGGVVIPKRPIYDAGALNLHAVLQISIGPFRSTFEAAQAEITPSP